MVEEFFKRGWTTTPFDASVLQWSARAKLAGQAAMNDPAFADWWVCENTWFIGVDALSNDETGAVGGSKPLGGAPKSAIETLFGAWPRLHKAQLSVVRPGYPKPRAGESAAAFGYRLRRDAAHVDGIKLVGPDRKRHLEERHAWILGLPLTQNGPDEAPLVVWEGSHEIMRRALMRFLAAYPESDWEHVDVTDCYKNARREVFETCDRIPVISAPGEGFVLHRLSLHGVAPWARESAAPNPQRMIAYFRPRLRDPISNWLNLP
ncbi:hypothetical protein [Shimia sp.]|uniref:hypothetical protein n=1 Tax=Shimia sp. TaxID=1954381 RepID=UPI0032985EBC